MNTTILAHFDGTNFVPDEPVNLPVGTPVRVPVESLPATLSLPLRICNDVTGDT